MTSVSRPQEVKVIKGRQVAFTCDARRFPLVIVNTAGEIEVPAYDEFFAWRTEWTDYAAARGTRLIIVALNDSMKPPTAVVRKHIAEKVKNDGEIPGLLASYLVVPNALLRGMVTAIMWVAGASLNNVKNLANLTEAENAMRKDFAEAGIQPPEFDAATYQLPT